LQASNKPIVANYAPITTDVETVVVESFYTYCGCFSCSKWSNDCSTDM